MTLVKDLSRQRLDSPEASNPIALVLVSIGASVSLIGIGIGIASQVLFSQQVSFIIWKASVGAVSAGLPLGLSGGVMLIRHNVQIRYLLSGLLNSLGAVVIFELTYPLGWETRYQRVGTIIYVSGVIIILGLTASAMQEWFSQGAGTGSESVKSEDEDKINDETKVNKNSTEPVKNDNSGKTGADVVNSEDEDEINNEAEVSENSTEPVKNDNSGKTGDDTVNSEDEASTHLQEKNKNSQTDSLESRTRDLNSEVTNLKNQIVRLDLSEFKSNREALRSQVDEIINRVDDLTAEIDGFTYQIRTLKEELSSLKSELDRVESKKAQSVKRVSAQLPDFDEHDGPRRPARDREPAERSEHRAVTSNRWNQEPAQRSESLRQQRVKTKPSQGKQDRAYPSHRLSNRPKQTASVLGQASQTQEHIGSRDEDLIIKISLTVLGIGTIVTTYLLSTAFI